MTLLSLLEARQHMCCNQSGVMFGMVTKLKACNSSGSFGSLLDCCCCSVAQNSFKLQPHLSSQRALCAMQHTSRNTTEKQASKIAHMRTPVTDEHQSTRDTPQTFGEVIANEMASPC
jgi:hypothetical protein